jgi:hypothetical protein
VRAAIEAHTGLITSETLTETLQLATDGDGPPVAVGQGQSVVIQLRRNSAGNRSRW